MSQITEAQVGDILGILKTNDASVDVKVSCLNELRSSIKHHQLLDSTVSPVFDIVRTAMASQHGAISSAGFAALGHLLKRLALQEPKYLAIHGPRVLPSLIERLGDQKDRPRALASQSLGDLWRICPQEVERLIRDNALVSRNPRTKETSLRWIAKMSQEHGLQFRSFVPRIVDTLEDADGMVRDAAKHTVVDLFQHAPVHAQADLKRQLEKHNVRKSIVAEVLSQLSSPSSSETAPHSSTHTAPAFDAPNKVTFLNEVANGDTHPPSLPSVPSDHDDPDHVEPLIVITPRDLEEMFRDMHLHFDGRENEQNWVQREKSILRLRRLTKGNALVDHHLMFLTGIKSLLDGILKCVNSLRTTLSTHSCSFVQELARAAGPGLDPMVELLLQNLIRLCAGTKKISSQMGNVTVDIIFASVSFNARTLQHIWAACQDKNVQPRTYASGWLETIINKHAHHRSPLEHVGGLESIERCIKKGLGDPNPGVREGMRKTFWVFAASFPDKADGIMSSLDANSKRLLERHPSNPSSGATSLSQALDPSASAKSLFSRSATAASLPRTTLKETIAARKREAAAARGLPNRPESAQATFSPPVKHTHSSSTASTGLASAPMRPARAPRRPDIIRPATAEPLASRQLPKVTSPGPTAPAVPASVRGRLKNESPNAGSGKGRPKRMDRANTSPAQSESTSSELGGSSHVRRDEELTMVIPRVNMDRVVLSMVAETESLPEGPTEPPPPPPSPKMVDSGLVSTKTAVHVESTLSSAPDPPDRLRQAGLSEGEPPVLASDEESAINGSPSVESTLVPVVSALRVYEDPDEAGEDRSSAGPPRRPTVLEERTVNEPVRNGHAPLRPTSASSTEPLKTPQLSPRKKMLAERPGPETAHGRRLLHASLGQIKAGRIDGGSLRTLRNAVDRNLVWPDVASFDELLWALLRFSPTGPTTTGGGGENNVEEAETLATQVLDLVRHMLDKSLHPDPSVYADVIKALLRARRQYESTSSSSSSSMVDALEETAERYGSACSLETCTDAVVDVLANDSEYNPPACVAMGFDTLAASLGTRTTPVTHEMAQRLGSVAARYLDDLDPALRRSVFIFCLTLHDHMEAHPHFWRVVRDTREDQRALINYRLLREEGGVDGPGVVVKPPR